MKEILEDDLAKDLKNIMESAPSVEVQQSLVDEVESLQKRHSLSYQQAIEYMIAPYLNDIIKIKKNS